LENNCLTMKKLVKESLGEFISETLKISGHEFKTIKIGDTIVYAGKEGVLGNHDTFISWETLEKIKKNV